MNRQQAISKIRTADFSGLDEAKEFGGQITIPGVVVKVKEDKDLGGIIFTFEGPGVNREQVLAGSEKEPGGVVTSDGTAPAAGAGNRGAIMGDVSGATTSQFMPAEDNGEVVAVGRTGGQIPLEVDPAKMAEGPVAVEDDSAVTVGKARARKGDENAEESKEETE